MYISIYSVSLSNYLLYLLFLGQPKICGGAPHFSENQLITVLIIVQCLL